ncbi:hypothetical protein EV122DRAFT_180230, partial [Schizophyllum commune]
VQRVMKLCMRKAALEDLVEEALHKLDDNVPADKFKLDTGLGVLRDRSVRWMVRAYHEMTPDLVRRAFELCRADEFNLSHTSLTSPAVLTRLRELPVTNKAL